MPVDAYHRVLAILNYQVNTAGGSLQDSPADKSAGKLASAEAGINAPVDFLSSSKN